MKKTQQTNNYCRKVQSINYTVIL